MSMFWNFVTAVHIDERVAGYRGPSMGVVRQVGLMPRRAPQFPGVLRQSIRSESVKSG